MTNSMNTNTTAIQSEVISVVGAGLAGCECAWQLAQLGHKVDLYEMRPEKKSPAHITNDFAELVCSNSFGSQSEISAPGQLKWEAAKLNSLILQAAQTASVPAGQALGVDRKIFSAFIENKIKNHPRIRIIHKVITSLDEIPRPAVIATGPLTDEKLSLDLQKHFGKDFLYFFDAIAPIIDADSIDFKIAWKQDRYDKSGTSDYVNCPLNREQYEKLVQEILMARKITPKDFEKTNFFEGCMPIEAIAERGIETLRFGPMKPVGLTNPHSSEVANAIVQLRQENREATSYNMVGFQTRMAYGEQIRVLRMIPGLENAEFLKLGSMHRNLYIQTPICLNKNLASRHDPQLFFAGQMTGVEGYFESTCIGLLVACFLNAELKSEAVPYPPRESLLGSLHFALTDEYRAQNFQPMNVNFGLFPQATKEDFTRFTKGKKGKAEKKICQIAKAKESFQLYLDNNAKSPMKMDFQAELR